MQSGQSRPRKFNEALGRRCLNVCLSFLTAKRLHVFTKALILLVTIEVERVKGIEPSSQAWEARILPLNHTRFRYAPEQRPRRRSVLRNFGAAHPPSQVSGRTLPFSFYQTRCRVATALRHVRRPYEDDGSLRATGVRWPPAARGKQFCRHSIHKRKNCQWPRRARSLSGR